MSTPTAYVHIELDGGVHPVGRLWVTTARGRETTARFESEGAWLEQPTRRALEPALTLGLRPVNEEVGRALFGAIGDSAPDHWGRTLIARAEHHLAIAEARRPRTTHEIDYLLGATDETRQGALRFATTVGGPFVADGDRRVPPLEQLSRLVAASRRVLDDAETDDDLRLLLASASALGGARPKASVRDRDGALLIAKFPARTDAVNIERWEALALSLARRAGIPVPAWRLERDGEGEGDVLLLRRFDRAGTTRIPFLSAQSMLNAAGREPRSYLEIAEAIRMHGAAASADLPALWRRIVFNVLVSNTDDHLRNHGFLYAGPDGWRLSPAYDLNPAPGERGPRVLATAIGVIDDRTASLELAFDGAHHFAVSSMEARAIARSVGRVVVGWREEAARLGLAPSEMDRMASAFEHAELAAALAA